MPSAANECWRAGGVRRHLGRASRIMLFDRDLNADIGVGTGEVRRCVALGGSFAAENVKGVLG
jgi:hypothetical protein